MDIYEKLKEIGLTGNEAKVYLELLNKGELSANQIAKNIGMDRTLAYTILNHLVDKGQVSYVLKEGKKIFSCSKPENLLNSIKSKEMLAIDLIKELSKIKKEEQKNVEINVYEGKEGIRTFVNLALREKQFYNFGATGRAYYALYEMPSIAKKVEKLNINVKSIGTKKLKGTEPFMFKKFQYRYLDIETEATTSIFGDYVSIHLIKGKPIIILIKNKDIAQSYKNYFEYLWKRARK